MRRTEHSDIKIVRGDTYEETFYLSEDLTSKSVIFTLKRSKSDADADALVQIVRGTGLVILNGSTSVIAGDASIPTVDDLRGICQVRIEAAATAELSSGYGYCYWDIQVIEP